MDNYNRYYDHGYDRRNDDHRNDDRRNNDRRNDDQRHRDYYEDRYRNDRDRGMRSYNSSQGNRGGSYDQWNDHSRHDRDHDRNMFERVGDRIRDTWNDWTEGHRPQHDRHEWLNRDRRRDYHGNYYDHEHGYHRDRDDRNFFERAGDKMRRFLAPPDSANYREYDGPQDYGRTGFGTYNGNYGAYTGEHGLTGYNTGNEGLDNYTTDYDRSYREPGHDYGYRRDDVYRRKYDREFRRRYDH